MALTGTGSTFEQLVAEALDSLPRDIAAAMDNVEVVIEQEPPPELVRELAYGESLFGYYFGTPLTDREHYDRALPDIISIYRGPIERAARRPDEIREQVMEGLRPSHDACSRRAHLQTADDVPEDACGPVEPRSRPQSSEQQ
jgi:predicted Zn-dependent protease with MMP-like domain